MKTPSAHLTSTDIPKIDILILLGYTKQEATKAYLKCNRDVTKASDYLDTHKKFNKKVQAHFSYLMDGTPGSDTLFGLGQDLELVPDIHDYYNLNEQLDYIKNEDTQSVT